MDNLRDGTTGHRPAARCRCSGNRCNASSPRPSSASSMTRARAAAPATDSLSPRSGSCGGIPGMRRVRLRGAHTSSCRTGSSARRPRRRCRSIYGSCGPFDRRSRSTSTSGLPGVSFGCGSRPPSLGLAGAPVRVWVRESAALQEAVPGLVSWSHRLLPRGEARMLGHRLGHEAIADTHRVATAASMRV
jgi:hypothetical protein